MASSRAKALAAALMMTWAGLIVADAVAHRLDTDKRQLDGLYRADSDRGHGHVPGFSGEVFTTYPFPVRINSRGYRGDEWTLDGAERILVLGDSFIFGEPLPQEQGIVARLQALAGPAGPRYYNAGVSGYGAAHVLATLRRECPLVRPKRVLYAFYFNDLQWDAVRTDSTTVIDGHLVPALERGTLRRYGDAELRDRTAAALARRSWSPADGVTLVNLRHFVSIRAKAMLAAGRSGGMLSADEEEFPPSATATAAALIRTMRDEARTCGAAFTMIVLPSHWEVQAGRHEPATRRLLPMLTGSGIEILDLLPAFPAGTSMRLPKDNHYNPDINARVAEKISAYFTGE